MLAVTASGGGQDGKLNKLRSAGYVVKCDHSSHRPRVRETYSRAEICDPNGYRIELRQWFRRADAFTV